jgi:hypothetical protein
MNNQAEMLKLKNILGKSENGIESMDSRTDQTEERVSLLNTGDLKIVDDE